ncbi:MAG: tryptophan synthase subunit beta, partial [Bacilli bacterium]|nr:tryptophan synthase subunit beta [Bacilli bacterium]
MKNVDLKNYLGSFPSKEGYFGRYGGNYTPEELHKPLQEVVDAYLKIGKSNKFLEELELIQKDYQGRPTPVYYCERLTNKLGGNLEIYLKREDLNHTGAHKLNHCMGEALLAHYMGKKKLIAETGAGQHGLAIATAAAYFGMECEVHMSEVDILKQAQNVTKMKLLGAKVIPVTEGNKSLKEAVDSAFSSYLKNYKTAIYCIGSAVGPHPFPLMVRDFQKVVGLEARKQFLEKTGLLPNQVIACVGGGSNSLGIFHGFLEDPVELIGVEPLGKGSKRGEHAATITYGKEGIMHGFNSIMLQDDKGNPDQI